MSDFWSKVDKSGECWLWLGAPNDKHGYGRHWVNAKTRVMAHRYAYELVVGPIPEGLTIDHLCRNTMCVNPEHLEPVSLSENVRRSECPPAQNGRKTHCKRGHEFTPENTIIRPDGRECRTCARMHQKACRARRVIASDEAEAFADAFNAGARA